MACSLQPGPARRAEDIPARDRNMFVAGLAHELRTPLAILKGRLHALEDGVIDPASGECSRLLEQVDKLLHITGSLTLLARAHAGELFLDLRPADLSRIAASCFLAVRAEAAAAGIELQLSCEETVLHCDPPRITQALSALARFTLSRLPPGALLEVRLASLHDRTELTLYCADWTPGFDDKKSLSVPAWGSADTMMAGRCGDGIDPAVAAALLDAHGWRLTVNRQPLSGGCSILVEIPAQQAGFTRAR